MSLIIIIDDIDNDYDYDDDSDNIIVDIMLNDALDIPAVFWFLFKSFNPLICTTEVMVINCFNCLYYR